MVKYASNRDGYCRAFQKSLRDGSNHKPNLVEYLGYLNSRKDHSESDLQGKTELAKHWQDFCKDNPDIMDSWRYFAHNCRATDGTKFNIPVNEHWKNSRLGVIVQFPSSLEEKEGNAAEDGSVAEKIGNGARETGKKCGKKPTNQEDNGSGAGMLCSIWHFGGITKSFQEWFPRRNLSHMERSRLPRATTRMSLLLVSPIDFALGDPANDSSSYCPCRRDCQEQDGRGQEETDEAPSGW